MATREQNEHDYMHWQELPDGGRCYWLDVPGRVRGFARYIKIVDTNEITQSFVQEIYDEHGRLTGRHQKYPIDTGHQIIETDDEG